MGTTDSAAAGDDGSQGGGLLEDALLASPFHQV